MKRCSQNKPLVTPPRSPYFCSSSSCFLLALALDVAAHAAREAFGTVCACVLTVTNCIHRRSRTSRPHREHLTIQMKTIDPRPVLPLLTLAHRDHENISSERVVRVQIRLILASPVGKLMTPVDEDVVACVAPPLHVY